MVFKDLRPILLLFHRGKLAETVISNHIKHQFAFKSLGTTAALVKFSSDTTTSLDNIVTKAIHSLLLDFSKAYDPHETILCSH